MPEQHGPPEAFRSEYHVATLCLPRLDFLRQRLGKPEATRDTLRRLMRTMLQRVKDQGKPGA